MLRIADTATRGRGDRADSMFRHDLEHDHSFHHVTESGIAAIEVATVVL
jgi:hypothetical protein